MVPIVVACLIIPTTTYFPLYHDDLCWIAAWIFVAAAISDFFDGYIARKRNIVTVFGSFLDPIADKFLVIASLIMLIPLDRIHILIVLILVLREVYMTSLRLIAQVEGIQVPVNSLGKWKTITQMTGIPMIMADNPLFGIPVQYIGPVCLYIASFLSVYSALKYTMGSLARLKQNRLEKKMKKQGEANE
jgi:CDP-diacylglycerol--glycerol-3-phosphate 3-phosphatidyltransferase